jgi:hypothetical protein
MKLKISTRNYRLRILVGFLALFVVQQSCTKINTDVPDKLAFTDAEVTQKFFALPANASVAVRRAADEMKRRNSQSSEFVKNFVKNNGYPAWDKAIIQSRRRTATASFAGSSASAESGDTIVIIPVVQVDIAFVNGFVTATLNGAVNLDLYRGGDYSAYSFNNVATDSISADKAAMQIMYFNYRVFGYTRFEVSDNRLLSNDAVPDTSKPHRVFEISSVQEPPQSLTGNESNLLLAVAICVDIYQTAPCIGIFTDLKTANYTENNITHGCHIYVGSECYTIYVDTGGGGGSTGPTGGSDPGGGTGGGGTGGTFPCASSQGRTIAVANPCGPANPPPVFPIPLTDSHGFYYSSIDSLNTLLNTNPFEMDPCDSLTLMNLATYGPMYQRIAQFEAPQAVVSRLDSIRQVQGGWIVDNYNFQSLQDAYGPVVNCDYFPLQISQFPMNYSTGLRMTPAEFLEYFRLNINNFISSPVTVNFSCTFGAQFDDCQKWNQPNAEAIGALNHIYIPGPSAGSIGTSNSGSIILSDYHHDNTVNHESHYFKFSTLETPFDYEHPVAGNREFGIFSNAATLNQYTFYTMGVDRIWDWVTQVAQPGPNYGFDKADKLWTNVQQNLQNYINSNGGSANLYAQQNM